MPKAGCAVYELHSGAIDASDTRVAGCAVLAGLAAWSLLPALAIVRVGYDCQGVEPVALFRVSPGSCPARV